MDNFVFQKFDKNAVRVCAAVCRYGKFFDPDTARQLLYLFYKDYKTYEKRLDNFVEQEQQEYILPNYVQNIFELVLAPRFFETDFLPFETVLKRVQKLVVLTYCHGAYSWMKLEHCLQRWLKKSPYSAAQKQRLLKSITVLAYSPDCPLGVSKAQFVSLASASDLSLKHGNGFIRYVHRALFVEDFGLSYLSYRRGNIFYCAQYSKCGVEGNPRVFKAVDPTEWFENVHRKKDKSETPILAEHDFLGFVPYPNMSKAALKLQKIGVRILLNALEDALSENPKLLSVFALIGGMKNNFWSCLKAKTKGMMFAPAYFWWRLNPNHRSFADEVRFVSID